MQVNKSITEMYFFRFLMPEIPISLTALKVQILQKQVKWS
jgi:hypothetical protein